jgi:hypothetical protein
MNNTPVTNQELQGDTEKIGVDLLPVIVHSYSTEAN